MSAKNYNDEQNKVPARHVVLTIVLTLILIAEIISISFWVSRSAEQAISDYDTITSTQAAPVLSAESCVASQPVNWLAGQVLMIGVRAADMTVRTALFTRYSIGGAVLMTEPADISDGSIVKFKQAAASRGTPLLISTDEEGGSVQRFTALGKLPAAQSMAANYTPGQAQQIVYQHGLKLKKVGVDMVLGPLADVAPQKGSSPLSDRVFSSQPPVVKSYDQAYINGWQKAGLLSTLKHFPGLGSASANTDYQTASTPPLAQLKDRDFIPYQNLSDTGTAVMIGNQNVPGWFSGPASLSSITNQYLRNTLGYTDNLVVTDSLSVPGVTNYLPEAQAVVKAIEAGNDMAMLVEPDNEPTPPQTVIVQAEQGIEKAVSNGQLSKHQLIESVLRKLSAQHVAACAL